MLCKRCKTRAVCSIFNMKKEHMNQVNILINSCEYHVSETVGQAITTTASADNDVFASTFNEEEYKQLINDMNNDSQEEPEIKVTCKTCGGVDYASQISYCSKCGKEVCGNCSTSENGLIYCNDCWGEM